jgi:hypothetical protein
MLYRNALFLAITLIAAGVLSYSAMALPTVKKFGANNTQNITTKTNQIKLSTTNNTNPTISLVGQNQQTNTNVLGAPTIDNTADSARLSGIFHGNIIKGLGSKLSSNSGQQPTGNNTPGDLNTNDLAQRVAALEDAIIKKQDVLEAGNGIDITGKTISLSAEITTLNEKMDEISQEIDDLDEKISIPGVSNNYYTIDETETLLNENYYDKDYIDQITSPINKANVVNQFDPGFLNNTKQ